MRFIHEFDHAGSRFRFAEIGGHCPSVATPPTEITDCDSDHTVCLECNEHCSARVPCRAGSHDSTAASRFHAPLADPGSLRDRFGLAGFAILGVRFLAAACFLRRLGRGGGMTGVTLLSTSIALSKRSIAVWATFPVS
jgi:hypothetical protein